MDRVPQIEEDLFEAARQIEDREKRREFLDVACGSDRELRARLDELLDADARADDFFSSARVLPGFSETAAELLQQTLSPNGALSGEEPLGTKIGRYKILEKKGEGGWGIVYLAEQEEPVRRQVALKIIRLGMETKSVIARFEAERQALALMDHPHIAHVYDAGATDRGLPYFVMELVHGVRITKYCDRNRLDLRQRLDLFVRICHAIQHAHQKGVIHGDIKPSNILVSQQDDEATPKVIDFGISKATDARLSDKYLLSAYAQLIGTPAYMSPEQAEMGGVDIDTRSDIYSLGVLLYELLTGGTPFEAKELQAAGLDKMRQILRERAPERPSARLARLSRDERIAVSGSRRTDPSRLGVLLRGDLDWIVMKALEKDRSKRYETANGLATDVQRFLSNEPVVARPPSMSYRLMKLVRRNRGVFVAVGAVAAVLVMGMGLSTFLFLKEREARRRAVSAEQQQARLRHAAEIREKITQATLLVSQNRFPAADTLIQGVPMGQPTVEGAAVLRSLGEWQAVHGHWHQAAQRFVELLRIDELDGLDVETLDYLRCGPALIESGNNAGYERFRRAAIQYFRTSTLPYADRIIKVSLLRPVDAEFLQSMSPLAVEAQKNFTNADRGGDAFTAAWQAVSLALLEYRRGDYQKAIQWCHRCLGYKEVNAPRTATADVILGMAQYRLGGVSEASEALKKGWAIFESQASHHTDRGTPVQGFWFDWEFARILLREGTAMIGKSGGAD